MRRIKQAYARSLMLVLMLMFMSHASVNLFVLSFVLSCACAYVASKKPGYSLVLNSNISISMRQNKKETKEILNNNFSIWSFVEFRSELSTAFHVRTNMGLCNISGSMNDGCFLLCRAVCIFSAN